MITVNRKSLVILSVLLAGSTALSAQDPQKIIDSLRKAGYNVGTPAVSKSDSSQVPDAVFHARVSGAVNEEISFTLKGNVANQSYVVSASHASTLGLLRVNIAGMSGMNFGFGVMMSTPKPGHYMMNESEKKLDIGGYSNVSFSKHGFASTSGSLTITKEQRHPSYTGTIDWFIDGHFEMNLRARAVLPSG